MQSGYEIIVLDLFHTSIGEIAILDFPNKECPLVSTTLERDDGASWKISGSTMGTPSEMTNDYKQLDPPRYLYGCKIEAQNEGKNLKIGDRLTGK